MEKHDVACSALLLHPIRLQLQRPIPFQRPLPPCTSVPSPITRIPMHHTSRGLTYGGAMTRAASSRGSCVRSALNTSRRSGSGGQPAQPRAAEAEKVRHKRCVASNYWTSKVRVRRARERLGQVDPLRLGLCGPRGGSNVPESTRCIPFPPVRAWGSVLLHHATDPSLSLVPLYYHL